MSRRRILEPCPTFDMITPQEAPFLCSCLKGQGSLSNQNLPNAALIGRDEHDELRKKKKGASELTVWARAPRRREVVFVACDVIPRGRRRKTNKQAHRKRKGIFKNRSELRRDEKRERFFFVVFLRSSVSLWLSRLSPMRVRSSYWSVPFSVK